MTVGDGRLSDRAPGIAHRYILIAGLLAVMTAGTWVARSYYGHRLASESAALQSESIGAALSQIEGDFVAIQNAMLREARRFATSRVVVEALGDPTRSNLDRLVVLLSESPSPPLMSAEIYDPSPRLIMWNGFSMPLDAAPQGGSFLDDVQVTTISDSDRRTAFALWLPVFDGDTAVGAVRILRLVERSVPLQNQFLKDYSLAAEWSRVTGLPVRVTYGESGSVRPSEGELSRALKAIDDCVIATLFASPPAVDEILAEVNGRFDDVMAGWIVLFFGWLIVSTWTLGSRRSGKGREAGIRDWLWLPLIVTELVGLRFAMIVLDIPNRYQPGKTPFAPLFDPSHLASGLGGGLFRSVGDLAITAVMCFFMAAAIFRFASSALQSRSGIDEHGHSASPATRVALFAGLGALVGGLVHVFSLITGRLVVDSTLDYFSRSGLMPDNLVLVVFGSLLTIAISIIIAGTVAFRSVATVGGSPRRQDVVIPIIGAVFAATVVAAIMPRSDLSTVIVIAAFVAVSALLGTERSARRPIAERLILRNVLPSVFLLSLLVYPLFFRGADNRHREQMLDAVSAFEETRDARALYAVTQLVERLGTALRPEVVARLSRSTPTADSLIEDALRGSLLASLTEYDVIVAIIDQAGTTLGGEYTGRSPSRPRDPIDSTEFAILRQMFRDSGGRMLAVPMTGATELDRFQYLGVAPLTGDAEWIVVRAVARAPVADATTPFPRVLLPTGFYGNVYGDLSLAEFRGGALVRSSGRNFGRYRLDPAVIDRLSATSDVWIEEEYRGSKFLTIYRKSSGVFGGRGDIAVTNQVFAARTVAVGSFDHLFFLLRLTLAGMIIGIPLYLIGLARRWQRRMIPRRRIHFRDKVLNAFFAVGMVAVIAIGLIGVRVVVGESRRAIETRLSQHLERVEQALIGGSYPGELAYRVLERLPLDSLAARVSLDLNVYKGDQIVASSRPQLIRDRLIDVRLPVEVHRALYVEGFRFVGVEQKLGDFSYSAGFRALVDEAGDPAFVVSVPILPEQQRIEEDTARTVAYLFGSLLLLVLLVVVTAAVIANALSRPIGRLRRGLEAVAAGRFEKITGVDSRDEIGELVESFNTMQKQLAESRLKLSRQERQLAWREMARQVAHEIKNPLTPMKLSVQHLRRAYDDDRGGKKGKLVLVFDRITTTLIEQIDALARIADEFSTFARMPRRVVEVLDLNSVVEEAAALMIDHADVDIELELTNEPIWLSADREELRRAYINLITNAFQSIPDDREGRVIVTTEIETTSTGETVAHSRVVDNGIGIPAELRDKIFVPNFSTKTSGTGLGLAIVQKAIEETGGEIGFETLIGSGTTFWITLPVADTNTDG